MLCQVALTTTVDGKKTRVTRKGNLLISDNQTRITYEEENAFIAVCIENGIVTLTRKGDYSLYLRLEKGKTLDGSLGLGGSEGAIQVKTERIGYFFSKNEVVLDLKYVLLAGEPQNTRVKIEARAEV